jgi:hypothetical protein
MLACNDGLSIGIQKGIKFLAYRKGLSIGIHKSIELRLTERDQALANREGLSIGVDIDTELLTHRATYTQS